MRESVREARSSLGILPFEDIDRCKVEIERGAERERASDIKNTTINQRNRGRRRGRRRERGRRRRRERGEI